jgi:uncharacterized membrane protein
MEKTSTGLQENVAGLLCYLGWWITGIIFLLIEKENTTVRFHAIQSIIAFGAITVVMAIFSWLWFIWVILNILGVILWIVMMVKTYQGSKIKLPLAGNLAEKHSAKSE